MGKIFKIQGLPVAIFKLVMIYLLIQLTDIPMSIVEFSRNRSGDFGFQTGLFVAALIISLITVSAAWYIYRGGRPIQRQQWSLKRHWLGPGDSVLVDQDDLRANYDSHSE
ncbi:hypothetical protein C6Y13_09060 [Lactiplantibacillus pentosus]|uniref:hypothetical protein n=1 Tax=Lactiplantibacillus pentosus TaxID=1589 RepID=UPI000D0122A2|nr:hypothetical protein [Lactiplantibacillus pentosus]PRO88943.1 hypothetical protein C6Y13_09060 [Lactiplantibacillus pentosus]